MNELTACLDFSGTHDFGKLQAIDTLIPVNFPSENDMFIDRLQFDIVHHKRLQTATKHFMPN